MFNIVRRGALCGLQWALAVQRQFWWNVPSARIERA